MSADEGQGWRSGLDAEVTIRPADLDNEALGHLLACLTRGTDRAGYIAAVEEKNARNRHAQAGRMQREAEDYDAIRDEILRNASVSA